MKTENLITDQEFLAQKSILAERRTVLESTPVPDRIDRDKLRKDLGEITEPLAQLRETWEYLPDLFRHRFKRLILPVGFVNGETRTAELGLLFAAFRGLSEGKTTVVPLVGKFLNQILVEIKTFGNLLRDSHGPCQLSEETVPIFSSE